jgi:hypothetical protein
MLVPAYLRRQTTLLSLQLFSGGGTLLLFNTGIVTDLQLPPILGKVYHENQNFAILELNCWSTAASQFGKDFM